ncbi:MAG: hypothetical protein ABF335_05880 [Alphaproteobacteria bacterium]
MKLILKILVTILSVLFIVNGVRWLVAPAGIAPTFGLELADGIGLSSQIGDMAGFFLTLGTCALIGMISGQRLWFYPAIMLLGITATGRIIAFLVHDATLATQMIGIEAIAALVFFVASRNLASDD